MTLAEAKETLNEIKETFDDLELKKDNLIALEKFFNELPSDEDDDDQPTITGQPIEVNLNGYGKMEYLFTGHTLIVQLAFEAFIESVKKNPMITLKRLTAL